MHDDIHQNSSVIMLNVTLVPYADGATVMASGYQFNYKLDDLGGTSTDLSHID
jgi:hypothetical protein